MMTKRPKEELFRVILFSRIAGPAPPGRSNARGRRKITIEEKILLADIMQWCEDNAPGQWLYPYMEVPDVFFETEELADRFHAHFVARLNAIKP